MIILFGLKPYTTLLATPTLVCPQCHNPAAHRLVRMVNKFTLFFVPLFAVSTKHTIDCTFCGLRRTPSRGEAEGLRRYAEAQQAPSPQP
ncbi:zinc-ribbon domain-containing protein [Georgenia subflava]|uniref:Zinc-ribbon domain-containing protein n=1 Tax=Georgenia subflava TaxID=1622177 RepID=A0A6N7EKC7_9MICO|nr:zinc-ribbon domain-containing protein [Georgenia subflava]MPV37257.1 zinc-ribbon domain-containing protein [Georgenia subflava]